MKGKRFTEEQIIAVLKVSEAGAKTKDLCRRHGISGATFYNWKTKYAGMTVSEARRLRELERLADLRGLPRSITVDHGIAAQSTRSVNSTADSKSQREQIGCQVATAILYIPTDETERCC